MVKIGDEFFEKDTGRLFRVLFISTHGEFITLQEQFLGEWIMVCNPERSEQFITRIKKFELIPATEAVKLLYDKK